MDRGQLFIGLKFESEKGEEELERVLRENGHKYNWETAIGKMQIRCSY